MITAQLVESASHIFIPRASNNHKARILHTPYLVVLALVVVIFQSVLSFGVGGQMRVLGYAANIAPGEVIRLTNEKRAREGLDPLEENAILSQAALAKGTDMLNKDYWAHVSPDGVEPWVFFVKGGYEYRYAGENLARDFSNPASAVEAWMASPSHKENVLSPKYRDIGVAVVEGDLGGVETTIIVQLFGTKATDLPAAIPVAAASGEKMIPPVEIGNKVAIAEGGNLEAVVAGGEKGLSTARLGTPFQVARVASLGLAVVLLTVLAVDALVVARKGVRRVAGKAFAQISFVGMVLAIVLIMRAGRIL